MEEEEKGETQEQQEEAGSLTPDQVKELLARVAALETDNTTLKGKVKETNGESAGRRKKIETIEEQQARLVETNDRLEAELATAQEKITQYESEMKIYRDRDEAERQTILETLPADRRDAFKSLAADQLRVIAETLKVAPAAKTEEVIEQPAAGASQGTRKATTTAAGGNVADPLAMIDAAAASGDAAAINKAFDEYAKKGR